MSLRGRVIALVGLVLLISLLAYMGIAWDGARNDLDAELAAARKGGEQTVASGFEQLPRSVHPDRDLRQLVATFDGNRHLRATLVDAAGRVRFASTVMLPRTLAPSWFAASLTPDSSRTIVPVPGTSGDVLSLQPEPASDIAALWAASSSAVGLFAFASVCVLALIYWVIGRALAPLAELARGLSAIGVDHHGARVREEGPPELLGLQRGFNAMATRLADTDARNRGLETQLTTIQDEERAEIARELHDEIGPHLFAVALDAEMIGRSQSEGQGGSVSEQVRSIQSAVSFMQRQVRELISRLRPTRAAELGLEAALGDLVAFWQARQPGITFSLDAHDADAIVPEHLHDVIYRVVQEAVANALRHADTTHMSIMLEQDGGAPVIAVANSGVVRPPGQDAPGLGLVSMRERVQATGGELQIDRAAEGWTVTARFPPGKEARG